MPSWVIRSFEYWYGRGGAWLPASGPEALVRMSQLRRAIMARVLCDEVLALIAN